MTLLCGTKQVPSPPRSGEKVAVRPDEGADFEHVLRNKQARKINCDLKIEDSLSPSPEPSPPEDHFLMMDNCLRGERGQTQPG